MRGIEHIGTPVFADLKVLFLVLPRLRILRKEHDLFPILLAPGNSHHHLGKEFRPSRRQGKIVGLDSITLFLIGPDRQVPDRSKNPP